MSKNVMSHTLKICVLLLCSIRGFAQIKGDYNWQLGSYSDISTHDNPNSLEIIFKDGVRTINSFYRPVNMGYFNASICNNEGDLLLYSNGCQIFDKFHNYIEGAYNLSPGILNDEWCVGIAAGYPNFQGGLFLSFFNDSVIILLHQRKKVLSNPSQIVVDSLFYTSVILNNGHYEVKDKTLPIVGGDLTEGNVEAIRAKKPGAWWVIQGEKNSNRYFSILIDSARVDTFFTQAIGDTTYRGSAAGQAAFSPDGTMYARYNPLDSLSLFSFDRVTGQLSDFRKYHVADSGNIGGLAFSPNSRFLYACSTYDMYQFDLLADDIQASKVFLGHYDGFLAPFPTTFYHMELGPDCKIYVIPKTGATIMHVINSPDEKGLASNFEQHGMQFPVGNSITLPNFPNFRIDFAPPCDPNISTSFYEIPTEYAPLVLSPNPTENYINIQFGEEWRSIPKVNIFLVDIAGKLILHKDVVNTELQNYLLDVSDLSTGVYLVYFHSASKVYSGKIIKQ